MEVYFRQLDFKEKVIFGFYELFCFFIYQFLDVFGGINFYLKIVYGFYFFIMFVEKE